MRSFSVSRSETLASRVTVEPSTASWSSPAFTLGGLFALSVTVTIILSVTSTVPSLTVRVNSMVVSSETLGAVNVVSTAELQRIWKA